MSERNKTASRAVFGIWMTGELDRLGEFVADDVVHHDPYDPHGDEGIEGHRKTIAANRRAFPDIELTIEDQIAEGDRLATRWTAAMTHTGESGGAPPPANGCVSAGSRSSTSRTARWSRPGAAWTCSAYCSRSGRLPSAQGPRPALGQHLVSHFTAEPPSEA